eukprot:11061516-Lingulodinium_polyedra.AAC.1
MRASKPGQLSECQDTLDSLNLRMFSIMAQACFARTPSSCNTRSWRGARRLGLQMAKSVWNPMNLR